ncbi:MAG TPA: rhomboid family intramembrane serine protease [Polyangiaceae bacterium]|nr:rhomboid family intramembrane serine protease [Polyangiaceae bacterium]
MFLPFKDLNPTRSVPFVTYLLIAANVAGYIYESLLIRQSGEVAIVAGYGLVATRLLTDPFGEAFTIFTSMFMHGGLAHLAGNLLYLHIFGDNVEDSLGHGRYLGFYLLAGMAAAFTQILTGINSPIPMVGASGAIAGVLGAYMVLFPRAPILGILFFFVLTFPAWFVIGVWFVFQNVLPAMASLGLRGGGVAFFAHIGGFIAGLLLVRPFLKGRSRRESFQWAGWRPPPRRPASRSRYDAWRDH